MADRLTLATRLRGRKSLAVAVDGPISRKVAASSFLFLMIRNDQYLRPRKVRRRVLSLTWSGLDRARWRA